MERQIRRILTDLGIYSKTKGFFFLIEAIDIYAKSNEKLLKITEDIYPVIAVKYKTTQANVERSIRYTIDTLYNETPTEYYLSVFGDPKKRRKPTNMEFIATTAYELDSLMYTK
jgi:two-component system response regulator (stage 0 sporulation protein A)